MDNQNFSPVNSLNSQIKDNQFKPQPKKRITFNNNKRHYILAYSTTINKQGDKI